jgi:hypothetical protein
MHFLRTQASKLNGVTDNTITTNNTTKSGKDGYLWPPSPHQRTRGPRMRRFDEAKQAPPRDSSGSYAIGVLIKR